MSSPFDFLSSNFSPGNLDPFIGSFSGNPFAPTGNEPPLPFPTIPDGGDDGDGGILGTIGGILGGILRGGGNILGGILGPILGGGGGGATGGGGAGGLGALLPLVAALFGRDDNINLRDLESINPGLDPLRQLQEGIFLNNPEFVSTIRDLTFNPPGVSGAERGLLDLNLEGDFSGLSLLNALGQIGSARGFAGEQAATGFRTDATPAFNEAIRQLEQNILPQIAETAALNQGISSSAFGEQGARAARDLLGQASITQLGLDEAAAERRRSGIPTFANLIGAELSLAPSFASDILNLGTQGRNIERNIQASPLSVFSQLTGLGQNQQLFLPTSNPQGNTFTRILGTLSDIQGSRPGSGTGAASPFTNFLQSPGFGAPSGFSFF